MSRSLLLKLGKDLLQESPDVVYAVLGKNLLQVQVISSILSENCWVVGAATSGQM